MCWKVESIGVERRVAPWRCVPMESFFWGDGCGGAWRVRQTASELGQGQAAAFCSLAKPPLTQRRGARLRGGSKRGSLALTAMETGVCVCRIRPDRRFSH